VQSRDFLHPFHPKDGGDFHQSLVIVIGLEQRKFASEEKQKNDSRSPYIYRCFGGISIPSPIETK
jgi:hypothetical protein